MQPTPENHEHLERLIHQTLRSVPNRRAPRSLEHRVLAALEARAALPWWQKSFLQWPVAARAAFVVASAVVLWLISRALPGVDSAVTREVSPVLDTVHRFAAAFTAVGDFCSVVVRNIPPLWLYGGLAALGALYASLFGLGATAYRTLYANR